jgi:hypothetical protein
MYQKTTLKKNQQNHNRLSLEIIAWQKYCQKQEGYVIPDMMAHILLQRNWDNGHMNWSIQEQRRKLKEIIII